MAIKVNFAQMEAQIKTAQDSYEILETSLKSADAARNDAVGAAGGTTTQVGAAINDILGTTMSNRLSEAKVLIDQLAAQMTEYKKTYSAANDDLLSFINTLKASEEENASNANQNGNLSN
jgi:hypothetical protein